MSHKIHEIIICLGSSCFARGNKKTLGLIQQYLDEHNLMDKTTFRGNHCFGKCHSGPNLKINGREYDRINDADIISIMEKEIGTFK